MSGTVQLQGSHNYSHDYVHVVDINENGVVQMVALATAQVVSVVTYCWFNRIDKNVAQTAGYKNLEMSQYLCTKRVFGV